MGLPALSLHVAATASSIANWVSVDTYRDLDVVVFYEGNLYRNLSTDGTNINKVPDLDTSTPWWQRISYTMLETWRATEEYTEIGEMVQRNNRIYMNRVGTANLNKDPDLGANKAFWTRLSPRVFNIASDPTTAAGGDHTVIDGDRWITYTAIPSGAFSRDTAPLAKVREGTNWMLVNSGVNVVADADAWGTVDKATSLVLLEKHITHSEMPDYAIDLAFKNRSGSWLRSKLWQMPWGQIHKFSWSGTFYAWNNHSWHQVYTHTWSSGSDTLKRWWKVTVTIDAKTDANGHNGIYRCDVNGDRTYQSIYIHSDTTSPRQLTFTSFHHSRPDFSMELNGAWQSGGACRATTGFVVVEDVGFVSN